MVDEAAGHATELALEEIRAVLADRVKGRPTRANFRTGHLTVCTLVPMRSVPHRVVCLLGLDDGVFPRKGPRDGDDLMLDDPHVGERDARTEDRQLLLDALMAATDKLIVTYTGNDERTNLERPPAVPVGELLDVIGHNIVTRHPLQPFDPRNFMPGELVPERVWSFEDVTLDGARALAEERAQDPPFLTGPLPPLDADVIELARLVDFVRHPVRAFLRRRLDLSLYERSDEVEDRLPVALDPLEESAVGRRLLEARMEGVDARTAVLAEIARGTLPPSVLGKPVIDRVEPTVADIVAAAPPGRRQLARRQGQVARADAERHRARRRGGRAAHGLVLAREPARPARGLGAAARADRRLPGPQLRGRHRRARRPRLGLARGDRPDRPARPPSWRSTTSRCSPSSTTSACASRRRSRPRRRRRTPAEGSRPRAPNGSPATSSTARTASPSTCWSAAAWSPSTR